MRRGKARVYTNKESFEIRNPEDHKKDAKKALDTQSVRKCSEKYLPIFEKYL